MRRYIDTNRKFDLYFLAIVLLLSLELDCQESVNMISSELSIQYEFCFGLSDFSLMLVVFCLASKLLHAVKYAHQNINTKMLYLFAANRPDIWDGR